MRVCLDRTGSCTLNTGFMTYNCNSEKFKVELARLDSQEMIETSAWPVQCTIRIVKAEGEVDSMKHGKQPKLRSLLTLAPHLGELLLNNV